MEKTEKPVHVFDDYHILNCPSYSEARRIMKKAGLRPLIGKDMADFITILCPEEYRPGLLGKVTRLKTSDVHLNHLFFWDFQKNRFTSQGPNNERGVWVVRDLEAKGLTEEFNTKEAESKLKHEDNGIMLSENGEIAFVPEKTYSELNPDKHNGYISARAFPGAYKHLLFDSFRSSELSPVKGEIYTCRIQDKDIESVSGLFLCYGGYRNRLFVNGNLSDINKEHEMFAVGVPEN